MRPIKRRPVSNREGVRHPTEHADHDIHLSVLPGQVVPTANSTTLPAIATAESKAPLLSNVGAPKDQHYVEWGVHWAQPALMLACFIAGVAFAVGHHVYYWSLNGSTASSTSHQQWTIRFGTAFAFLVQSLLNASVVVACTQCVWAILRNERVSIGGIDKIFSLTSDLTSFWSWELLRRAHYVVLLALLTWLLPFAAIVPPAALSVVSSLSSPSQNMTILTHNWTTPFWSTNIANEPNAWMYYTPRPLVQKTVTATCLEAAVVSLPAPATNASYALQFHGPTLQCERADEAQQAAFDEYLHQAFEERYIVAASTVNLTTLSSIDDALLLFSAWVPPIDAYFGFSNIFDDMVTPTTDGGDDGNSTVPGDPYGDQIWVQLSNESIVCKLMNGSFDVGFNFSEGTQTITHRRITVLGPIDYDQLLLSDESNNDDEDFGEIPGYSSTFSALATMLTGNITVSVEGGVLSFIESSSQILYTGLSACAEIAHPYWEGCGQPLDPSETPAYGVCNHNYSSLIPPSAPWMCRNHSFTRSLEDMMNNVTISMLSDTSLLKTSTPSLTNVTTNRSGLIYSYSPRNLLLSYGVAILLSLLALLAGLQAFRNNGVSHTSSFSAIASTTRHLDHDGVWKGQSLGAPPLPKGVRERKLRFGVLLHSGDEAEMADPDVVKRVGFGLEDKVGRLDKGARLT